MINHFRDHMIRPLVGLGHSMGSTILYGHTSHRKMVIPTDERTVLISRFFILGFYRV